MGLFSKDEPVSEPSESPTQALWREFGEDSKKRATDEFAAAEIAKQTETWLALPKVDHFYDGWRNLPCPKCGLLKARQRPSLGGMGGQEFTVGIRRDDQGELELYADTYSVMLSRNFCYDLFSPSAPIGKTHRAPRRTIVIVTCECGCHIGNYRPSDADVESDE